jgi:hypothetical protein
LTIRFVTVILIPCVSVFVLAASTLGSQPGKITMTDAELASLVLSQAAKDPLADPALSPSAHPQHAAGAPGGNTPAGNPSSMAGANTLAGMGSGIGGTSTGSSSAGGGSAGGSGGGASGTVNQLNTLGIQGAFAGSSAAHSMAMTAASGSPAPTGMAPMTSPPASPPPPDPVFQLVEGTLQPVQFDSFTDPTGNPNGTDQYSASIDWGGSVSSEGPTMVTVNGSTIQISSAVSYDEEGTFPITLTVSGPGGPFTENATAVVTDAALTTQDIGGMSLSATAGQPFSGEVMGFHDDDPKGEAGEYTTVIDWGDGTPSSSGSIGGDDNQSWTVQGSHTSPFKVSHSRLLPRSASNFAVDT